MNRSSIALAAASLTLALATPSAAHSQLAVRWVYPQGTHDDPATPNQPTFEAKVGVCTTSAITSMTIFITGEGGADITEYFLGQSMEVPLWCYLEFEDPSYFEWEADYVPNPACGGTRVMNAFVENFYGDTARGYTWLWAGSCEHPGSSLPSPTVTHMKSVTVLGLRDPAKRTRRVDLSFLLRAPTFVRRD